MRFELDEDDRLLCDSVAEFARQHVEPHASAWDEAEALPPALTELLRGQGLLSLRVPEEDGGIGLSAVAAMALIETLARFDASVAFTVAVHNFLGGGGGAQGLRGFARLTDGRCAHALLPNTATEIVVVEDGEAHLVAADAVIATRHETLGLRAADLGTLQLTGPKGAAVAVDDAPMAVAVGAIAVGIGEAAFRRGRDYALERVQFGQPIANYQAIQWKLADFVTGLDAARLMVLAAAASGDPVAAARASLKATAVAIRGCSDALQIHGGYGYTREFPVERYLRDARFCGLFAERENAARSRIAAEIAQRQPR